MNDPGPRLARFFQELKRRRVFRATAAYLVVASGVVAVAADAFPALELPPWTVKFVVILAVLGLPVTVALSWAFDVRPSDAADAPPGAEDTSVGDAPSSASDKGTRTPGGSTAPTQRWTAGRIAVVGAVAVLALAGLAMLTVGGEDPRATVEHRVAVLPFENQSGDRDLDELGIVAADWLTDGLASVDSVQVIPTMEVREVLAGAEGNPLPWLARATHAGLAVTGSYVVIGDSVQVRAQLVEPGDGQVLQSFQPARSHRSDPTAALGAIRQQAMGAVAMRLNSDFQGWEGRVRPPTYEAYREFLIGLELFNSGRYPAAIRHLDRSRAADSTFFIPYFWLVSAFGNRGMYAQQDSVLRLFEQHRSQLSELERIGLDRQHATARGDLAATYRLSRQRYDRSPMSVTRYIAALYALQVSRPRETVELLEHERPEARIRSVWYGYHSVLTAALHVLGDHQRELEAARQAQVDMSDHAGPVYLEARALAGLGRPEEAVARIDDLVLLASSPASASDYMSNLGDVLAAHDHWTAAEGLYSRALATRQERGAPETAAEWRARAGLLFRLGRLDDAAAHVTEARALDPDNRYGLALEGRIAAQQGDRARAKRVAAELAARDDPYHYGDNTYNRAAIRALLGDLDRAVELLRQAHTEGQPIYWTRMVPDFRPLRGHPGFEELLRPRGEAGGP